MKAITLIPPRAFGSALRFLCLVLLFLAVGACSTTVTRPDDADATRPVVKALQSVTLEMSPTAKSQLADSIKFDQDELYDVLERTLDANGLMASDGDFRLRVLVEDIRVRSTFNAIMWGFMAGDDHLIGEIIILNLDDEPIYSFDVNASYAAGGLAGGQDSVRMNWLYEEFSDSVAEELKIQRDKED